MAFYQNWYDLENFLKDHQKELLAEAARERLLKRSKTNNPVALNQVRQWLGKQLVAWGLCSDFPNPPCRLTRMLMG